jgi:hypothetical protein
MWIHKVWTESHSQVLSESPLEKLMIRLEEMSKNLALEGQQQYVLQLSFQYLFILYTYHRDAKKWRRREFVIMKDSPIFSFQGLLASLPNDDPPSATTTLVSSSPSPYSKTKAEDSACDLPHSPFRSPVHEKRKCRQFIRDLVRKVFPTSGGGGDHPSSSCFEPERNAVSSRWSCSTGDSDWTAISTSGSVDDDRGGGDLSAE